MDFDLAKWVMSARNHAGLTQEELAHKINLGGKANISAFEKGRSKPTFKTMWDIGQICGYPLPQNQYAGKQEQTSNGHTNNGDEVINVHQENNNFSEKNTMNGNFKPVYPKKLTVMEALQLATPFAMKRVSEEFFEQEERTQGYSIEQAQIDTLFEYARMILLTYPHYKCELERLSVYDDAKRIYPTD